MSANPFPFEVFPPNLQDVIQRTHQDLNFPIEFISSSILYATSIAIGNSYKIEIKKGFVESAVIYLALVGRAGTNKSHPLTFALEPFLNSDKKSYAEYKKALKEYDLLVETLKKKKKKSEDDEVKVLSKPVWVKHILTDFTPEALVSVHSYNTRGVGVYADEIASWFKNFNRFNKGSEMELWLSAWSGKPISVDRKTGDSIFIPMPHISVAGTIQNNVLPLVIQDSRGVNGFIDRMLFCMPDHLLKERWTDTELDKEVIAEYHKCIEDLLKLPMLVDDDNHPHPTTLRFSDEAKKILFEWQEANTVLCNNDEEETATIYPKLEMYVPRFAMILHLLHNTYNLKYGNPIVDAETVQGAIKLGNYFLNEAIKVREFIKAHPVDKLPPTKKAVYDALPQEEFSTGQGVVIAESNNMSSRNFDRFIKDQSLFKKLRHGVYQKLF